jgi:hypothetical protein
VLIFQGSLQKGPCHNGASGWSYAHNMLMRTESKRLGFRDLRQGINIGAFARLIFLITLKGTCFFKKTFLGIDLIFVIS